MWNNRNVWIILTGEFIAGLGLWTSIIANLEFMQQKVPSDFMKSLKIKGSIYAVEGISFILGSILIKKISEWREPLRLTLVFAVFIALAQLSLFLANYKFMAIVSFGMFGMAAGGFFPIVATQFQSWCQRSITVASSPSANR